MLAVVLDASALAAILFAEPGASDVVEQIDGRTLFAPDLIRYEIANVCLTKLKQNPGVRSGILEQFAAWEHIGLQLSAVPSEALIFAATQSRITAYDAAYLCLARALNAELVTLDNQLRTAWQDGSR
jgi:predicted nucleic acid-binding protein